MLSLVGVIILSLSSALAATPLSAEAQQQPCPQGALHQYLLSQGEWLPRIKLLVGDVDYGALLLERRLNDAALAAKHKVTLQQIKDFRALKPKRVAEVLEVLKQVSALVRTAKFETPQELTIHLSYQATTGISGGGHLHVPYQMAESKGASGKNWTKHPKFTRAVIAHELAHEVFHLTLKKRFPELDDLRIRTAEESRKRTQARADEYDRLKKERDLLADLMTKESPRTKASSAKLAELEAAMAKNKKAVTDQGLAGMWHGRPLDGPYNELFADVVAVIYARDPEGMRDGIYFTGADKDSRKSAHWRDFDGPPGPVPWSEGEEHVALQPTRKWLWESHLAQSKDPVPILRAVFEGIYKEVTERYRTGVWELPPDEMNRRLIERIDAEIKQASTK